MARIFMDGWEHGNALALWTSGVSNPSCSTGISGMSGTYCLYNPGNVLVDLPSTYTEMYASCKWRLLQLQKDCLAFSKGTTKICGIYVNPSGFLVARIGDTDVATGTKLILTNTITYRIEVYFKMDDSVGRVIVKVDDIIDIDFTGDTKPGADADFDRLGLGTVFGANGYFDDVVLDDSGWVGITEIVGLKPSGAGNSTQWSPSAGSNYQCVDEVPYNDADYVSETVAAQKDLFAIEDLASTPDAIKCVTVTGRVVKDGSPTPANVRLVTRTESTDYNGDDEAVPLNNPKFINKMWEINPNTTSAWTESDINALEIGIESRT